MDFKITRLVTEEWDVLSVCMRKVDKPYITVNYLTLPNSTKITRFVQGGFWLDDQVFISNKNLKSFETKRKFPLDIFF